MNWIARGKHKDSTRSVAYRVIGGADDRDAAIDGLKGSHPTFEVESIEPLHPGQVVVAPAPQPAEPEQKEAE